MKDLMGSRATVVLPFLMLPAALGALWLLARPQMVAPRVAIVLGTVAVAWYLLGGWIAARRLAAEWRIAGQVRAARAALRNDPGCSWIVDPNGRIRAQSPAAKRTHDLVERDVAGLLGRYRADPEATAARLMARVSDGRSTQFDLNEGNRLIAERVSGTDLQRWRLDSSPAPDVGTTDEPFATRATRALDLASNPVAMLDMDAKGVVRAANPAAEAMLGKVAPGMPIGDLLEGLGRPLQDWISEVREGRQSARSEVMRTRAEGIERDVQVTLAADPAENRIVAVLTDASALKTLEAQFVQSQKMQAIGQLAGGIAHDFNNLLTAISGHCDLLMVRRDKTDQDYDDLHQISQNANRAAALVRQLLAFSRKQTLKPEIMDLRDTLSDLTHLLNRLVGERIVLTVGNDPNLRPIRSDARQLEQVLINLVVNARDAMPEGGEIAIRTENIRLGANQTLEGANLPKGDYVRITVSDQGVGMAPEILDKIFEPFFTTKRPGEGTGLGLSTAYGIVKQTGGYIFCNSIPGKGTVFSLYYPAQKAGQTRLEATQPPKPFEFGSGDTDARRAVVLLVEDEAPVRSFARRALELRGFRVIEADSGEAALDVLNDERLDIDIFVTDVVMPGLDGPSWVRKALRDRPGTKVIFMSGYTETTLSERTSPIPRALFLPKPFSLSELIASVENHLAGRPGPAVPARSVAPAR